MLKKICSPNIFDKIYLKLQITILVDPKNMPY